ADGTTYRLGRPGRAPDLVVRLHDRSLDHELALAPFFHLGEAYVEGTLTLERGDVFDLFELFGRNLERLSARGGAGFRERAVLGSQRLGERLEPLLRRRERAAAREDLASGHDPFLDWDPREAGAYFADPRTSLEAAQAAE